MKKYTIMIMAIVAALLLCFVDAQTGRCNRNTRHACVDRNKFKMCLNYGNGDLRQSNPELPCNLWNGQNTCYGGARDLNEACGPAPPPCTMNGQFAVPGRCRDFYVCSKIATGQFHQFLAECLPGQAFSEELGHCTTEDNSNCIELPTESQIPSTTPNLSTVPTPTTPPNPASSTTVTQSTASSNTPLFTTTLRTPRDVCQDIETRRGRHPDPDDCRNFFTCQTDSPVFFTCPFQLFFNADSRLCVSSTDCGTRPILP